MTYTPKPQKTLHLQWQRHLKPEEFEKFKDLCFYKRESMSLVLCELIREYIKRG